MIVDRSVLNGFQVVAEGYKILIMIGQQIMGITIVMPIKTVKLKV